MAKTEHSSTRRPKPKGSISTKQALALFDELMSKPAQVPENFCSEVDRGLKYDPMRRVALMWLSKSFKEWTEKIENDREIAVEFASVALALKPVIERFKGLVEMLEAAKLQMEFAVCIRPDMDSVKKEAASTMDNGVWIADFARRHEAGEDPQDIINDMKAQARKTTH